MDDLYVSVETSLLLPRKSLCEITVRGVIIRMDAFLVAASILPLLAAYSGRPISSTLSAPAIGPSELSAFILSWNFCTALTIIRLCIVLPSLSLSFHLALSPFGLSLH